METKELAVIGLVVEGDVEVTDEVDEFNGVGDTLL